MSNSGKWLGFAIGVVLVGVGIATGNVALIIQGSAMIVTQAIVDLTAPKVPARQASEMTLQLGEGPRSAFFGEGFTAGSLVDGFDFGGKYGTDWEVLIIRLADHKCEELVGFYVNDDFNTYVGDGLYPAYDDQLEVYFRSDTTNDPLPSIVTTNGPGWTATDIGESGCDVIVAYKADKQDDKHPGWPGGRPRFGFVIKGKLCYDPRLDSTVSGGSGSHRWNDPSTWEWSDNAAVCRYNWARGIFTNDEVSNPAGLLVGRGLTELEAPPANIFAAANLCDETVDGAARYRVAGPIYANQEHIDVEEMFALATGGSTVTRQGSVELEPGAAKSITFSFTDDDILVGSKVAYNQGILSESSNEWINSAIANYVEPTQKWNDHAAPVVRDPADILTDGKPREAQLSLRLVRYVAQALRVAEIARRFGRLWGRASVTLGPRFCEVEEGDWGQWTSARYFGGDTKTFRVEAYKVDEKWQNTLTLREIETAVFGDTGVFQPDYSVSTNTTPPPDIGTPDSGNWALAAVTLTNGGASVPALEITGSASDDGSVGAIIVEYWKADGVINPVTNPDDPTWIMEGSHPPSTTKVDITSIQSGGVYYVAISYVVSGILGDRLVRGPVTAGTLAAPVADGDKGDITVSSSGATWTVDNDVVTYAKMQNVSATSRVIGRKTSGAGDPEELTLSDVLDFIGSAVRGDVLYRGASAWARLAAGTSGQVLRTNGASADPSWASVGSGTSGGASFAWPIQGAPGASGTATAAHGTYFTALTDFTVLGLWAQVTTVVGATYRVSIYQVNTSGVISAITVDSGDIASPGAITGTNVGARFSTPVTLTAGNNYIVCFRRTDSTDSAVVGVFGLNTALLPTYTSLPVQYTSTVQTKFATLAKANPAVSDTFTLGGTGYYVLGVLYTN
jgi:hypothetical protein